MIPQVGCRMRASPSAWLTERERTSNWGWYHSSSQPAPSASPTSIGGSAISSVGSSEATLRRRVAAPNGVSTCGSIAISRCSASSRVAAAAGQSPGPSSRTLPSKPFDASVCMISAASAPIAEGPSTMRSGTCVSSATARSAAPGISQGMKPRSSNASVRNVRTWTLSSATQTRGLTFRLPKVTTLVVLCNPCLCIHAPCVARRRDCAADNRGKCGLCYEITATWGKP